MEMILTNILVLVLIVMWVSLSFNLMLGIVPYTSDLSIIEKIIVAAIVTLGTPFLFISQGIEAILGIFLPEGWNDDDDELGH